MDLLIINMAMSVILATIKNPAHKEQFKKVLLKVRDEINLLYPGE